MTELASYPKYPQLPLISVVMPVYNEAFRVRKAVDSIRQQTWHSWELIIVDDASTDETWEILCDIAASEPRIRLFRNGQNVGAGASRNCGLAYSQGEFIAVMDSDDVARPDRLQIQVEFLLSHPGIDVLGAAAIDVDEYGNVLGEVCRREWHQDLVTHIYKECPFIHSTVLGRASFWKSLGGYATDQGHSDDYELWLRGYQQFTYHNLSVPLIWYLRRPHKASFSCDMAHSVWVTIRREHKVLTHGWYALRPLVAYWVWKLEHR